MPRCRDCTLYDLDAAKDRAGRVRFHARCKWESTEVWPISVTAGLAPVRAKGACMPPSEVHRCQRFVPRPKA